jgi:hypothetical protein
MGSIISKFTGHGFTNGGGGGVDAQVENRVHTAADELYRAECAWHDAHQTRVDAWILAASAKLDAAVASHLAAVAATAASVAGGNR